MEALKVILVDDNEPFRNALKNVLMNKFHVQIIGEASCGAEFNEFSNLYLADIILMDVMMPDIDGISLTKKALWANNHLKFIAITMHYDKVYLTSLLEAGFKGCVFKSNIFSEISRAIETVMAGKFYFPENILLNIKDL
jgi:DNA-binding NarL/FixJ family response regulator